MIYNSTDWFVWRVIVFVFEVSCFCVGWIGLKAVSLGRWKIKAPFYGSRSVANVVGPPFWKYEGRVFVTADATVFVGLGIWIVGLLTFAIVFLR